MHGGAGGGVGGPIKGGPTDPWEVTIMNICQQQEAVDCSFQNFFNIQQAHVICAWMHL